MPQAILFFAAAVVLLPRISLGETAQSLDIPAEHIEFFEKKIRPVLVEHCYECHSANAKILQGGLRLDAVEGLRAGGDSGPVFEADDPSASLLLSALKYESYEMPPGGQLPDEVIADFAQWLELGAPDPRSSEESSRSEPSPDITAAENHWSFVSPSLPATPEVENLTWPHNEIDRFALAKLEQEGLAPSHQASPRTLLRRVYYDLIGLPPAADDVDAFSADPSDAAYAAAVDRLLASPQFGERWGRHWLDVARYADTKGYVFKEDRRYVGAYKYRDWVINAFNNDFPYDDFVVAQLAADQLDDASLKPAMGYLTLGRRFLNNPHDIIDDRIDVVSRGLMGLTVSCARCHDHKYDPIPTADYYALYGVFSSSKEEQSDEAPWMLVDKENPSDAAIFVRGNPRSRGEATPRRFLTCLTVDGPPPPFEHGSGRMELAQAIASNENPLTARVWVNRVWGHLFGSGLVSTPSDFGTRGSPPTHPKLLDWLACKLMENGWSTKQLIRSIVLSSTYRQSSATRPDAIEADPENRLLWRANRRRLGLESLRDSIFSVSGELDSAMGGPSVSLTDAPFSPRRSVYGYIERQNIPAFFRTFDFASPNAHTPQRPQTVTPQQALFMLNSPLVMQQASALSERSQRQTCSSCETCSRQDDASKSCENCLANRRTRIECLFRMALGRSPSEAEQYDAEDFLQSHEADPARESFSENPWQFGWGSFDGSIGAVDFHPLTHFKDGTWQGGPTVPDESLGWVMLTATGGHPGDRDHSVIRRFVAPQSGSVQIRGRLKHPSDKGDGIRGRIVVDNLGKLGDWRVAEGSTATNVDHLEVQQGDAVDFVVDCRRSESHDSFEWETTIKYIEVADETKQAVQLNWPSKNGFHGPLAPPLDKWEQLAQVLLMSNEFAFID